MIAILKLWIFGIILFQNQAFFKYIDNCQKDEDKATNTKLLMTIISLSLLYISSRAETTYQEIIKLGILMILSPAIIFLHIW